MNAKRTLLAALLVLITIPDARAIVGRSEDAGAFADRIVMVLSRGVEGSGFCTGVVLAPRVVLTAAHCLRRPADTLIFYRDGAGEPVTIPVAATATHPLYHADAIARRVVSIDVGLLETATALPETFHPAQLADGEAEVGEAMTAVGFGVAREGEAKTGGSARAAALRVREPASKILLWAEDPEHEGLGACAGDSGAPISRRTGATWWRWSPGPRGQGTQVRFPHAGAVSGSASRLDRWGARGLESLNRRLRMWPISNNLGERVSQSAKIGAKSATPRLCQQRSFEVPTTSIEASERSFSN